MLATAKNYDATMYHYLKVAHKNEGTPFQLQFESFLTQMRDDLIGSHDVKTCIDKSLNQVWDIRIKALKWILKEDENIRELLEEEVVPRFEEMTQSEKLGLLAENILFALRCNKRVLNAVLGNIIEAKDDFVEKFSQISFPEISFDQTVSTILLATPNNEEAQCIVEWLRTSLHIEYVIVAAAIIDEENLAVSNEKIDQLSFFVADAAQTYSAIAVETGLINHSNPSKKLETTSSIDKFFFAEQQILAETDLLSFSKNWKD